MMEITGKHNKIQGSQLLVAVTPEKGFFTKSRKRYTSQKDGKEHSKFLWIPETVRDIWVTCDDKMYQIHFMVANSDGSVGVEVFRVGSINVHIADFQIVDTFYFETVGFRS